MIIVFEGPEKSGKTTLINYVVKMFAEHNMEVKVRKFTGPMTSESQYLEPLLEDAQHPKQIVLYDRGWVSETVYSSYFNRKSTLCGHPARAEQLFSSIVDRFGLKYMVLPADPEELTKRRDETDLPIPVEIECGMFLHYAMGFDWTILPTMYTEESLTLNGFVIFSQILQLFDAVVNRIKMEQAANN